VANSPLSCTYRRRRQYTSRNTTAVARAVCTRCSDESRSAVAIAAQHELAARSREVADQLWIRWRDPLQEAIRTRT
jgi:hypothetical protein